MKYFRSIEVVECCVCGEEFDKINKDEEDVHRPAQVHLPGVLQQRSAPGISQKV